MYNLSQEQTFILFIIIGIIIGILLDLFRAIRKVFKTSDTLTLFEDIILILISRINNYLGDYRTKFWRNQIVFIFRNIFWSFDLSFDIE